MFVYLCCVKYYSVSKTVSNILHTKRESKCLNWSSTPINRTLKLITLCENKRNQPVSSIFTYHPLHCLKSSFRHHFVDNDHFVRTHECFLFGIIGNKKKTQFDILLVLGRFSVNKTWFVSIREKWSRYLESGTIFTQTRYRTCKFNGCVHQ